MSTHLNLLVGLTGACALVAAAVLDVPSDQRRAQQQGSRDCDARIAETAVPAPPSDPHLHARALGACLARPGDSVK